MLQATGLYKSVTRIYDAAAVRAFAQLEPKTSCYSLEAPDNVASLTCVPAIQKVQRVIGCHGCRRLNTGCQSSRRVSFDW